MDLLLSDGKQQPYAAEATGDGQKGRSSLGCILVTGHRYYSPADYPKMGQPLTCPLHHMGWGIVHLQADGKHLPELVVISTGNTWGSSYAVPSKVSHMSELQQWTAKPGETVQTNFSRDMGLA